MYQLDSRCEPVLNLLPLLEELQLPPIPVQISENPPTEPDPDEPLVSIMPGPNLAILPLYYNAHIPGASPVLRVRAHVRKMLERAASLLPKAFAIVVFDAWRSEDLQRNCYKFIQEKSAARNADPERFSFNLDSDRNQQLYPSDDAPHRTGGAVDIGLGIAQKGLWPMGTLFDEPVPESATNAFEIMCMSSTEMRIAQLGRRLLYSLMRRVGFSNYPAEWWHYDYGNAFWRNYSNVAPGPVYRTVES